MLFLYLVSTATPNPPAKEVTLDLNSPPVNWWKRVRSWPAGHSCMHSRSKSRDCTEER